MFAFSDGLTADQRIWRCSEGGAIAADMEAKEAQALVQSKKVTAAAEEDAASSAAAEQPLAKKRMGATEVSRTAVRTTGHLHAACKHVSV